MIRRKLTKLSLAVLLALGSTACTSKKANNDLAEENLKGPVMSVEERQYMAIQDFENVKQGDPFRPGTGNWDEKKTYNKDGFMIEYLQLSIGDDDTITSTSMVYDSIHPNRRTLSITDNENHETVQLVAMKYNKEGKVDTISYHNGMGTLASMEVNQYEHGGERQVTQILNMDKKLERKIVTIFKDDLPISIDAYNSEGKLQQKTRQIWKDELLDSVVITDGNNEVLVQVGFDYDQYGNVTNQHGLDQNKEPIKTETYTYEYDDHNNWVRRTHYVDGKPFYIMVRYITYYEDAKGK